MKKVHRLLVVLLLVALLLAGISLTCLCAHCTKVGLVGNYPLNNTTSPFNSRSNTTYGNNTATPGNNTAARGNNSTMGNIDSINFGNNTLYTIIGNNTGVVTYDNVSAEERPANVSPAREASREENDTTTSAEPKNHMQFELSGGVPRSIAYNKPDNRLFAKVPDHSSGSVSMRLDGLMLDGGRQSITLGGRIYT